MMAPNAATGLTHPIVPGSLWFYAPNKGAPIFFAIAFSASTLWQIWQTQQVPKAAAVLQTQRSRHLTRSSGPTESLLTSKCNSRHYKCWRTTGILSWAAILFTAGFIAREMAAFDYGNLTKLIVSVCLVYMAP